MKNIKKLGIVLTLFTFTSLGCSTIVAEETSSSSKEVVSSSLEALSDLSSMLKSTPEGETVTLEGQIIGKMQDCHIFTDGNSNIIVHLEDENSPYNPDETVKISGTVINETMPHSHHFEHEDHSGIPMDVMIMVNEIQVLAAK